nr:MAG TPA: hypothetical protein [Caudoviricetes sp.]
MNRRYTSHSSLERRATFHFNETEKSIPSAYHLSNSTVDFNVLTHFEDFLKLVFNWVRFVPIYLRLLIRPPFFPAHFFTK